MNNFDKEGIEEEENELDDFIKFARSVMKNANSRKTYIPNKKRIDEMNITHEHLKELLKSSNSPIKLTCEPCDTSPDMGAIDLEGKVCEITDVYGFVESFRFAEFIGAEMRLPNKIQITFGFNNILTRID